VATAGEAGGRSGGAAAEEIGCGFRYLALVDVTLEGGGAGGAERELAEAVPGGVALGAAGGHADDAGAGLARAGDGDGLTSRLTSRGRVTSRRGARVTSRRGLTSRLGAGWLAGSAVLVRSPEA
jgi:hypothetical protein